MTGEDSSAHGAQFYYIAAGVYALELVEKASLRDAVPSPNIVLWIGGLGDTIGHVSYPFSTLR